MLSIKSLEQIGKWNLLFFVLLTSLAFAQPDINTMGESKGPQFHLDTFTLVCPNDVKLSRLNLFIEMVFDELQFVKMADNYEANYDVSVVVYDKDNNQIDGKNWKESMTVDNFDITNRRNRFSQSYRYFDLEPGRYKLTVSVQDLETKLSSNKKIKVQVKDYSLPKLMLSEIGLLSEIVADSFSIKAIRPEVSDLYKGITDSTFVFFEIYNPNNINDININYELLANTTKKTITNSYVKKLNGFCTYDYFPIFADSLRHDSYTLSITASHGKEQFKVTKDFYVRWRMLPATATDLNTAIEQVRYIATKEEWKKLSKAKEADRLTEFSLFWKRHDPTPGTEANEAMDSHYARVEYANQNFSGMQRAGWRTDMGILYIILGPPDDIERNAYPRASKPYEIWYYYRISRNFFFYDYTGFGDYRLDTPYSIYEFQRLLNN